MVQFYPWFKSYFLSFQTHCQTLPHPKTKENKIQTRDKTEPQHIYNKKKQSERKRNLTPESSQKIRGST